MDSALPHREKCFFFLVFVSPPETRGDGGVSFVSCLRHITTVFRFAFASLLPHPLFTASLRLSLPHHTSPLPRAFPLLLDSIAVTSHTASSSCA